jgi:hypothetical protein
MRFPSAESIAHMPVPLAESPLLEHWIEQTKPPREQVELLRRYATEGYLVTDLGLEGLDGLLGSLLPRLEPLYPEQDRRILEAWMQFGEVRTVACAPRVLELLHLLYGRHPIPFQTLNFDRGTEQPAHSDTLHFHCAPRHFMAGAWVAFEDIHPDSGPLVLYPGSHRLPDLDIFSLGHPSGTGSYHDYEDAVHAILAESGIQPLELCLERGQVAIWAANLFHGGVPLRDSARIRQSQVTHYDFEDCLYDFPMSSDPFARRMCMREVIDLRDLCFVSHRYRGQAIDLETFRYVVSDPRPLPAAVQRAGLPEASPPHAEASGEEAHRVIELEELCRVLRMDLRELRQENEELVRMLHSTWESLPFRLTHGLRMTWRSWRGGQPL